MGSGRFFHISIALAVGFALMSPGCGKGEKKSAQAERRVNVRAEEALKKRVKPSIESIGTIKCYDRVRVASEIEGILKAVYFDEGRPVGKGTVLATVDDRDIRLEVERAEAALFQAEASLANTKVEFERKKSLFEEKLVTAQQFDDVSARLSIAEGELRKARSALAVTKQKLEKTIIRSPMDGVVEEKKLSAGDYLRPGTELFSIIKINPVKLDFTVAEKEIGKLKTGQEVSFMVDVYPEREFKAKVRTVYPSLEEATRTLRVEAEAPNPGGILKPGLFVHVVLYTGAERDTVLVPSTSLLYEGETIRAFVLNGDTVSERSLKAGQGVKLPEGEFVEVLEGIKAGELVVVAGQQNLVGGAKVNVAR